MANNKASKMKQQQPPPQQQQQQQVNGVPAKNKPQEPQPAAQQQTAQQPQESQPTTTTTNNDSVAPTTTPTTTPATNTTIAVKATTSGEQSQQQQESKPQQTQSQQQQTNTQQHQPKNGNHQKSSKINGNKKHQNDGGKGTTTIIFGGLIPKAQASMQNTSASGGNGNAKVHQQQSNKRGGGGNNSNNNAKANEAKSNNNTANRNNMSAMLGITNTNYNNSNGQNRHKNSTNRNYHQQQHQQQQTSKTYRNSMSSYAQTANAASSTTKTTKSSTSKVYTNSNATYMHQMSCPSGLGLATTTLTNPTNTTTAATSVSSGSNNKCDPMCPNAIAAEKVTPSTAISSPGTSVKRNPGDILTAALAVPCGKCAKPTKGEAVKASNEGDNQNADSVELTDDVLSQMPTKSPLSASAYNLLEPALSATYSAKQYRKSKSYVGSSMCGQNVGGPGAASGKNRPQHNYYRSFSDRRSSFDRNFAERNKGFVPIVQPARPVLSSSNIAAVIADTEKLTIIERIGKGRTSYPIMQCGTLDAPDSSYHQQRSNRMDVYQIDDGFHSDGGTETPPPSPSSGSSIASTSDHGSLESVDTGGTQRLAVLSFEQVRKLHDVMDEKVAIHGRGNFPTLEVNLKDLVNAVRRKLEADIACGGAGVIVKDIRLNGGAASHVLASEDQPYNDLDLIYAIELSTTRHFDRVKTAVLNTLHDLLPEGVSKRRIIPGALKEAYVGKMVKVNNNNDGDRWSLISLGNSPGHKNVELKFVDTMRRQFEFSVDSFQIVLDSLLLFYDCAALPISENFYPTVVGESVYGDFQEALYHLQKKLISTRQPEEIRGGGLLKYCNLLVRNYKPVDPQHIKTLERYMCSRFFIDFPDINMQTVKLEAYLRNHFWGVDEEPLQYQYLMHLREVVEMSTVCLMGHERRQTLHLIQNLASQVFYKEQQKQQQQQQQQTSNQSAQQQQQIQCHEAYQPQLVAVDLQQHSHHHHHHHQQQQQHLHHQQTAATSPCGQPQCQQQCQQQQLVQTQPQTVTLVATTASSTSSAAGAPTTQTIYVQQAPTATICCAAASNGEAQQQQQQQAAGAASTSAAAAAATNAAPQTIQIQAPPGLIYANGVYYAPVIPTAICTCNATWLST